MQQQERIAEARARLAQALALESEFAADPDYLCRVQRHGMTAMWRARLFEWMLEFVDGYGLAPATVAAAMNYVDRYLSQVSTKKCVLQLAALSALLIASKMFESRPLAVRDLCGLAEGIYQECDLRLMEMDLIRALRWRLNAVTPLTVLEQLIPVACSGSEGGADGRIAEAARALAETALCEMRFLAFRASDVAAAAIACASDLETQRHMLLGYCESEQGQYGDNGEKEGEEQEDEEAKSGSTSGACCACACDAPAWSVWRDPLFLERRERIAACRDLLAQYIGDAADCQLSSDDLARAAVEQRQAQRDHQREERSALAPTRRAGERASPDFVGDAVPVQEKRDDSGHVGMKTSDDGEEFGSLDRERLGDACGAR